ncbi:hypothetical protein KIL84_020794 [Mauremys mutica]|uniref:Uncharacterized protein n=1 Tax=Mauremys mutica TaxID=74926 RepID=A0A9D3XBN7_9SAUR|nr:hypothetical protein KIL84_020794 [Mauremys mutica]
MPGASLLCPDTAHPQESLLGELTPPGPQPVQGRQLAAGLLALWWDTSVKCPSGPWSSPLNQTKSLEHSGCERICKPVSAPACGGGHVSPPAATPVGLGGHVLWQPLNQRRSPPCHSRGTRPQPSPCPPSSRALPGRAPNPHARPRLWPAAWEAAPNPVRELRWELAPHTHTLSHPGPGYFSEQTSTLPHTLPVSLAALGLELLPQRPGLHEHYWNERDQGPGGGWSGAAARPTGYSLAAPAALCS